jgi:hypothetical protein
MWNNVVVVYIFVKCASKTGGRGVDIVMVGWNNDVVVHRNLERCEERCVTWNCCNGTFGDLRQKGWFELGLV